MLFVSFIDTTAPKVKGRFGLEPVCLVPVVLYSSAAVLFCVLSPCFGPTLTTPHLWAKNALTGLKIALTG